MAGIVRIPYVEIKQKGRKLDKVEAKKKRKNPSPKVSIKKYSLIVINIVKIALQLIKNNISLRP